MRILFGDFLLIELSPLTLVPKLSLGTGLGARLRLAG